MPVIEERVSDIENALMRLAYMQMNTQINLDKLSQEMKDFKQEMKEFKEELRKDTKEMKKEINNQWEKVVKKLGTLVEDMVIPNIEFIAEKHFGLKNGRIYTRTKIYNPKDNADQREFDVIAMYPEKIILVEAKSNPKPEEAKGFIELIKGKTFFEYFPEYKGKELIPIFASFHIPENVLKMLSKNKIYAMGVKEDTMDILNPKF